MVITLSLHSNETIAFQLRSSSSFLSPSLSTAYLLESTSTPAPSSHPNTTRRPSGAACTSSTLVRGCCSVPRNKWEDAEAGDDVDDGEVDGVDIDSDVVDDDDPGGDCARSWRASTSRASSSILCTAPPPLTLTTHANPQRRGAELPAPAGRLLLNTYDAVGAVDDEADVVGCSKKDTASLPATRQCVSPGSQHAVMALRPRPLHGAN